MPTDDTTIAFVSNRGPLSFVRNDGGLATKRGAGGLASALDTVARGLGERALWVCAAASDVDREALHAGRADALGDEVGYRVEMLDIEGGLYDRYYNDVSNRALWFANHRLWDEVEVDPRSEDVITGWRAAYDPVNERFARATAEMARAGSLVLFQDYHLSTAPRHLRSMRPEDTSIHFTHSSFCWDGGMDRLDPAIRDEIARGMCGADIVGFHVAPWAEAFLRLAEKAGLDVDRKRWSVSHEGRTAWVRAYPLPIDAGEVRSVARSDESRRWLDRFEADRAGVRYLVRADRIEPSKNIVRGFEAFGRLLDRRPDLAGSLRFLACVYPSRTAMPEYRVYADRVQAAVRDVEARHPGSIVLMDTDDFPRTVAALSAYDVLVVNSIMDGMNLVSKEGPSVNGRSGAVALSRSAGSFGELGSYCTVIDDPLDVDETARAIERALEMDPAERETRAEALRRLVSEGDPQRWIEAQITDLEAVRDGSPPVTAPQG